MPEYKVPVEFRVRANSAEEARDELVVRIGDEPGLASIGEPSLVAEVLDRESEEFRAGYGSQSSMLQLARDSSKRLEAAFRDLQSLQGAATNYKYGMMTACQEVVDEARKQAHGGFGFSGPEAKPLTGQARIDQVVKGGW